MRKNLGNINGSRTRFRATVKRFGSKKNYHGYPEPTILLIDVAFAETDKQASDHIWFTVGTTIKKLGLKPGDVVEFDARVGEYIKGYVNRREYIDNRTLDYKLNRPTKFAVIQKAVANA